MTEIPATGSDVSGFIAQGLWRLYQHFPSSGRYDWLILFTCLTFSIRLFLLSYLWKAVKMDMEILAHTTAGEEEKRIMLLGSRFASVTFLGFWLWFFTTPSGEGLLTGRCMLGIDEITETYSANLEGFAILVIAALLATTMRLGFRMMDRAAGGSEKGSQPYPTRGFLNLYAGGGRFRDESGSLPSFRTLFSPLVCELLIWISLLSYGHWPVPLVILVLSFVSGAVAVEGCRLLFVAVLHKRTFG